MERFHRIPGSAGAGCGLGLAIVKEIANLPRANLKISTGNKNTGTKISLVFELVRQVI